MWFLVEGVQSRKGEILEKETPLLTLVIINELALTKRDAHPNNDCRRS